MIATHLQVTMPKVEIYTTHWCPYCHAAKSLLDEKGVAYEEVDADDPDDAHGDDPARAWPPHRAADLRRRDAMSAATTTWRRSTGAASSIRCSRK